MAIRVGQEQKKLAVVGTGIPEDGPVRGYESSEHPSNVTTKESAPQSVFHRDLGLLRHSERS